MRLEDNYIPQKLYKQFLTKLPLCCVDVVLVEEMSAPRQKKGIKNKGRFLLVRRRNAPAKGKWWLPGGRLLWREDPISAVRRKLREELGIKKVNHIKLLGIGQSRFNNGYFGVPYHSINLTFVAYVNHVEINLDTVNHTDYRWFENISSPIPAYVANFLEMAGFKRKKNYV